MILLKTYHINKKKAVSIQEAKSEIAFTYIVMIIEKLGLIAF